jgi:S-DNA-T family DNA segregation ATPase FtsK/SpoIIIE
MSSKKILLPESGIKERTRSRKPTNETVKRRPKMTSRQGNTRTLPTTIDARQRSEATGLVLVGISAFTLSLLHYLSSSKVPGLVNSCMVHLGMGVYILPAMIGLLGIQRFLERPFTNIGWRIAGIGGVMFFGLGLLGLEGGKAGVYALNLFSGVFGPVPSKVLFSFLLLSSMIFALDILYKDILAASLIVASLTTRFMFFCWEITLSLLSMVIGAVKTTADLLAAVYRQTRQFFSEQDIDPARQLGRLLSFKPRVAAEPAGELEDLDDEDDEPVAKQTHGPEAEEATVIPVPRHWQDNLETPDNGISAKTGEAAIQFQVSQIASHCLIVDAANTAALTTPPPCREDEPADDEELRVLVSFDDDEENESTDSASEDGCVDNSVHTAASDEVSHETEIDEEPVCLEDNLIDKEIKTGKYASQSQKQKPTSEVLLPPIEILKIPEPRANQDTRSELSERSAFLIKTLEEFGIKATVTNIIEGPAVSRFEIKPAPGVKVSRITGLIDDIALALAAQAIRIEAPIPGKSALGIEIPNPKATPVYFYELLKNEKFGKNPIPLNLALGVTIDGKPVLADLSEMPHLLIAGSTGSGKSVCVNTIIASILFQARADQVKFVMIDPKMVELSSYNGIPHLIAPVVTDPAKASAALMWAVEEMTRRYEIMAECGCKKISTYNEEIERLRQDNPELEPMPFIVIVIDELADLMMTASAEVEGSICRLAQMARAVGMHLVIATQRPSVNVLTGLIKANLPTRIAFSVTSAIDSRTILDAKGAERLLGKGDMLFIPKGRNKPLRLQGAYVSDSELMDLINFVKQQGQPEYMDIAPTRTEDDEDGYEDDEDAGGDADSPLIQQILKYLETQEKTSTSMLQRKFRIGYNRAARIMDQLEEKGLVSPMDGANKRRVLIGRSNTQV